MAAGGNADTPGVQAAYIQAIKRKAEADGGGLKYKTVRSLHVSQCAPAYLAFAPKCGLVVHPAAVPGFASGALGIGPTPLNSARCVSGQ